MPILCVFTRFQLNNKISFFIKNVHFSTSNITWVQNNLFYRIQRPLKPLFSYPTRFFIFFEKNRFCVFFAISILAITFFAHSGFLRILDMFFYGTWLTIGVNLSTIFFFSTKNPNFTRLFCFHHIGCTYTWIHVYIRRRFRDVGHAC